LRELEGRVEGVRRFIKEHGKGKLDFLLGCGGEVVK
jgi:hypothetical protein